MRHFYGLERVKKETIDQLREDQHVVLMFRTKAVSMAYMELINADAWMTTAKDERVRFHYEGAGSTEEWRFAACTVDVDGELQTVDWYWKPVFDWSGRYYAPKVFRQTQWPGHDPSEFVDGMVTMFTWPLLEDPPEPVTATADSEEIADSS